jgi:hypothetical protein
MDWKEFGRRWPWPNRGRTTVPEFTWTDWGKSRNISVRIADFPAENRTEVLPDKSLDRYRSGRNVVYISADNG